MRHCISPNRETPPEGRRSAGQQRSTLDVSGKQRGVIPLPPPTLRLPAHVPPHPRIMAIRRLPYAGKIRDSQISRGEKGLPRVDRWKKMPGHAKVSEQMCRRVRLPTVEYVPGPPVNSESCHAFTGRSLRAAGAANDLQGARPPAEEVDSGSISPDLVCFLVPSPSSPSCCWSN